MLIQRTLEPSIRSSSEYFPVVAIIGPRQAGKTTLAKMVFEKHTYISLEDIDMRTYAAQDPRGFLDSYKNNFGLILDEFQHVPDLLSYIQTYVDREQKNGYFILTGSQNFLINEAITQTLAGRIAIHTLLPFSIHELNQQSLVPADADRYLYQGSYPPLYAKNIPADTWYRNYIQTYIERDVRHITNIGNLSTFQTFLQLCAGRVGQVINLTSLGNDCGISTNTVKQWLSILQASYIIFLIQPHYKNFSKRLIKSPKIYFYDTGLICSLLKITAEQLPMHYLKGGLFESLVISEIIKQQYNKDINPTVYFWRDQAGHEVDCIVDSGLSSIPIEIKAGKTISTSFFDNLTYWKQLANANPQDGFLIYAGTENQKRSNGTVLGWQSIDTIFKN
ncbi:MAG: ATP-binding protein [Candidatus Dependentiae bacterium]|nr:ATP-binding protein [Candidatus Dependentiae bacterium]